MVTAKMWTIEELERTGFPEGRWELIDGALVEMSPSGGEASAVAAMFVFHLVRHVLPRRLGTVFSADGGFVVYPDRDLLRAPDAAFVRAGRAPTPMRGFPRLAPDLVVEVISPTDVKAAVFDKALMWLDAGVRLVWVADPDDRTVTVFSAGRPPHALGPGDLLRGGDVLPRFRVPVAELFAQQSPAAG